VAERRAPRRRRRAEPAAEIGPPRPRAPLRVCVTGATGFLGGAIAERLVRSGHDVQGLARSDAGAAALASIGVRPLRGDLEDADALLLPLRHCDAVIHAAGDPDDREGADRRLLDVLSIAALDGRVRRILYTSSVWVHGDTGGTVADERAPLAPPDAVRWQPSHEHRVLDLADHDVHVVVFRPGMVYGGRRGTFGEWFEQATSRGTFTYPGDGSQHWGVVHRDDVADAYQRALEDGHGGERLLLVDDSRPTVRELAEAVARATGAVAVPSGRERVPGASADAHAATLMDQQFTAARARRVLSWHPAHPSFVAEVDALFREWKDAERAPVA
jgi:nucleoside-diphosphate-sugar epimerase